MKKLIAILLLSFSALQSQTLIKLKQLQTTPSPGSVIVTVGTPGVPTYTASLPAALIPTLGYLPLTGGTLTGSLNLGANSFSVGGTSTLNTLYVPSTATVAGALTTPSINGVGGAITINSKPTLLDEMYLGASAIYGIWSWNASTSILRSGTSAVNLTLGTPTFATNFVLYNSTGNVAIGGVADNATDQLQVSNHIGTPVLNLRGRSGAAPTQLNFLPFDATNSIINFKQSNGTVRGFIDLNISSGEMKFWGSAGGYFPTFGSNGSERMRIHTGGQVSIGNTSATASLNITGTMSVSSTFSLNGMQLVSGGYSVTTKAINVTSGDAATINSPIGRFRKDNSGTTFVLTNSQITANSIITLQVVTAGLTGGKFLTVQAGAGSATITFEDITTGVAAAPSADMDVNFMIMN